MSALAGRTPRWAWVLLAALAAPIGCADVMGLSTDRPLRPDAAQDEAGPNEAGGDANAADAANSEDGFPADAPPGSPESAAADLDAAADASPPPDGGPDAGDGSFGDGPLGGDASGGDASGGDASGSEASVDDAQADSPACGNSLAGIGTGDFHITLDVTTTQTGTVALVNQRAGCGHNAFWDIRIQSGFVHFESDDSQGHYVVLTSGGAVVNDGKAHQVRVARASGIVYAFVDGVQSGSTIDRTSFAALPALQIGTDPCQSADGTIGFVGTVANVCVDAP